MRLLQTVAALALLGSSLTDALNKDQYCVDAVYEALSSLSFEGSSADVYWESTCQNLLKVGTIYASAKRYCTDHEISAGTALLRKYCLEYGKLELLPYSDFQTILTEDYLSSLRVIDYEEIPATENVTAVVLISTTYFEASFRTIVSHRSPLYHRSLILNRVGDLGFGGVDASYIWVSNASFFPGFLS
jgi:hypothetical protein